MPKPPLAGARGGALRQDDSVRESADAKEFQKSIVRRSDDFRLTPRAIDGRIFARYGSNCPMALLIGGNTHEGSREGPARGGCARRLLASRLRRHHADDRHRQQRRHDPDAEADGRFHQGQSRHQAELGDARRERAAPEGDDRHRHQGRPVRRADHRHLRGADLGARRAGWFRSTSSAPTTTSTICCPPSAPASPSTASSTPRRSTARARW